MAEWDLAACQAEIERNAGLVLRGHLHEARHDYRRARATAACSSWRPGRATRTASIPTAIISSRCATQPGGRRRLHRGAMRQRARDQIPDTRGGHAVKDEIRSILIEIARQRGTIAYSELVQKVRTARLTPGSPELAAMLGELSSEEDAAGRGMLSALVVSKSDRKPGAGFFSLAREARAGYLGSPALLERRAAGALPAVEPVRHDVTGKPVAELDHSGSATKNAVRVSPTAWVRASRRAAVPASVATMASCSARESTRWSGNTSSSALVWMPWRSIGARRSARAVPAVPSSHGPRARRLRRGMRRRCRRGR